MLDTIKSQYCCLNLWIMKFVFSQNLEEQKSQLESKDQDIAHVRMSQKLSPFTPVIRSTSSMDKAIKVFMLCPATLSHQKSYLGSGWSWLMLHKLFARWQQCRHVSACSLEVCCNLTHFRQHFPVKTSQTNTSVSKVCLKNGFLVRKVFKSLLFVCVITWQQYYTWLTLENVSFTPELRGRKF